MYKIASFELTDLPLIEAVAKTGKPMIMSTGMASKAEITEAVNLVRSIGDNPITLLKCTSTYPAKIDDSNLHTLSDIASSFDCQVGLSDHTQGIAAAVAATALGASVIEKHFVLDRQAGGVDAAFSMEPEEMLLMVETCRQAAASLGKVTYGGTQAEQDFKKYRRSIYIAKNCVAGERLSAENIKIIRPSLGLAPKYWSQVIGKKLKADVAKGQALTWSMLEE